MTFDLDSFLPYRLSVAAAMISQRFATLYAQEAGLSIPEWRVLAHLSGSGAVSVRDIQQRVSLEKSSVSRAATRLEDAGYITKSVNTGDRRLLSLILTPKGRALMERLGVLAASFQQEIATELGPDLKAFDSCLGKLMSVPE